MLKTVPNPEQVVQFSGLQAPLVLKNAEALVPVFERVLPTWPFTVTDAAPEAVAGMTITGRGDGTFICDTDDPSTGKRRWDGVNAVCEAVVALAWAQIQSNPSWLCLHCAAVEFNGRLVLFPNKRRSGKSTLTAVLAQRGHRVYTDDFLPVRIDENGVMLGVANGINPRLRLPVVKSFSPEFRDWVQRVTAVSNDQYAYLGIDPLAPRGAQLPVGAVVVLDRQDAPCDTRAEAIEPVDVLDDLIVQNFGRMAHSGRILEASHGVATTAERHRLAYYSAEDAARYLEGLFQEWAQPVAQVGRIRTVETTAQMDVMEQAAPAFDPDAVYQRAGGVHEINLGDQVYVSDGHGVGIQKLNPGSALIWRLLEESVSWGEITEVLAAAFPDHPRDNIAADSAKTLQEFLQTHLITAVETKGERT